MNKKIHEHKIKYITTGSIAEEMELEAGDVLLSINDQQIEDVFDYHYLVNDEFLTLLVRKSNGEEWELEIEKDYEEDLGIEFEQGLMDEYRSCSNNCIFCFIDQMPKGMRDTLYFKDDDSRLSFLQGNYVTLTNMSDHDIDRIVRYHLEPINISFQTTNPKLRCMMLHNRFAGEALKKVDRLYEGGIQMNGQIVLCKGINDGAELERTISDLTKYLPNLQSVSVVPVGLSKFREGLYPLEPFRKEDAREVLSIIHKWQEKIYAEYGFHFIHAGDEWYILAEEELPEESRYDGYLQLENGVGMLRLLVEEFEEAMNNLESERDESYGENLGQVHTISMATGKLAFPYIKSFAERLMERLPKVRIHVYEIENRFFGELITVSGLITGQDLRSQLMCKELGEVLLLPVNMLRSGEDVFLDDLTLTELSDALQVPVRIVKSDGQDLVNVIKRISL